MRGIIYWLETRLNRRLSRDPSDQELWSWFESHGRRLDRAPDSVRTASSHAVDLLVVITTYNRPGACERLVRALAGALRNAGRALAVHVLVVEDRSDAGYEAVRALADTEFGDRLTWMTSVERFGKTGFSRVFQAAFKAAEQLKPTHALFVQDDVAFHDTLVRDTYRIFDALGTDARRRVLYLFNSLREQPRGQWIRFTRAASAVPGVWLTQWFDLQAFFVDRAFFDILGHQVFPVPTSRWRRDLTLSSGVGAQLTYRLFGRGNIYQPVPSLVTHGTEPTEMNPEKRLRRPPDDRPPAMVSVA